MHCKQTQHRRNRFIKLRAQFKGKPCIGIQLDMWYDSDTHTCMACANATTVEEPTGDAADNDGAALSLMSEIIEFATFPFNSVV